MLGIINRHFCHRFVEAVVPRSLFRSFLFFVTPPELGDARFGKKKPRQKGGRGVAIWLPRHIDVLRQPASVRANAL